MGKQTKSRKAENTGKGKVTPVQIAFIVDRYLADNNYTNTRTTFRNEASDLISRSPVQEAPRSLLSLGAMLDEYISLKEQKVMLDQEKRCFEQETFRVQNLLKGMQDVMNVYTIGSSAAPLPPPIGLPKSESLVPQIDPTTGSPAGYPFYNTPVVMSASRPFSTPTDSQNFSTLGTNHPTSKRRKGSKDVSDASVTAKRSRSLSSTKILQVKETNTLTQLSNVSTGSLQYSSVKASPNVNIPTGSPVQGSSVAKCLFNQSSQSPPTNSSEPNTPPRATTSLTDKSVSTPKVTNAASSNYVTPQQMTSTNCTVIASETITVSPAKQMAFYSIERNCRISSSSPINTNMKMFSKRVHVKGKLDFDGSGIGMNSDKPIPCEATASETDKEVNYFDFDLPNLDVLGPDFSFSELLGDFDLVGEELKNSYQPDTDSSPDSLSGSPHSSEDAINGANQVLSELSSTVTEIISEKNMNKPGKECHHFFYKMIMSYLLLWNIEEFSLLTGQDSVTSMKSVTNCIKILSPESKNPFPRSGEFLC